jgi:hypothetical protein
MPFVGRCDLGSVIPSIAVGAEEEDTGQWGRSVGVGLSTTLPDSGLFLARQPE